MANPPTIPNTAVSDVVHAGHPGVNAVRTMGGDNILIQIKKNKSLVFSAKGEKLLLEKSLFFGGNKILNNFCISIFGEFSEQTRLVKWEIKRET